MSNLENYKYLDGIEAYEYFIGEKIPNRDISLIMYKHSTGVLMYHPIIGFKIYCNKHKSRYKNQLEVIEIFNKLKQLDENTIKNYKCEVI